MIDKNKDVLKRLQGLGLSAKEARVYLALLPHSGIGSSKIISATGLHGQFVYNALNKLEELGLAKHVIERGRKKFSAASPLRLLSLAEEKKQVAQNVARELQLRFQGAHEQDFEVFQGETSFIAHEFEMLETAESGSTICVIGGFGDRYFQTMGTEAGAYEEARLKKQVAVRYIGSLEQEETLKKLASSRRFFEFRVFPGLSTGVVNTNVYPGFVTLNIFGDPVLSFTITNKAVADGYKEFFESLWALSKP